MHIIELSPRTPADTNGLPLGAVMKTLTNRMGSVVTGDALADAVVEYHDALVTRKDVDLVDIPVVGEANGVRHASFAIGWLTEVVSAARPHARRDVEDEAATAGLHALAKATRAKGPVSIRDFAWARPLEWE